MITSHFVRETSYVIDEFVMFVVINRHHKCALVSKLNTCAASNWELEESPVSLWEPRTWRFHWWEGVWEELLSNPINQFPSLSVRSHQSNHPPWWWWSASCNLETRLYLLFYYGPNLVGATWILQRTKTPKIICSVRSLDTCSCYSLLLQGGMMTMRILLYAHEFSVSLFLCR